MNKFEKISRCALAMALALVLFTGTAMTASAADAASLDFNETGSVTLTLADSDGNAVSGGAVTIYEVAKLYLDDGNMAYDLTEAFAGCTAVLDVTDTSLAKTLAEYAAANNVSGTEAAVGTDGTVTFAGLELGLYLVVQTTASEDYETINPFVVTVPIEEDGVWEYAVNATPKVGTVTQTETETPEETTTPASEETTTPQEETETTEPAETETPTSEEETTTSEEETTTAKEEETTTSAEETTTVVTILPQTGQLNWPVPVLAVCGLLFFGFGWALKRSERKENDA